MISLFIFKSNNRGMRYGIGTYIKQLSLSLLKHSNIKIYIVNYHSSEYKEYTIRKNESGLNEIHIPPPNTTIRYEKQNQKYASRLVDLLTDIIKNQTDVVFQINFVDALEIAKVLKSRFSYPVLSVVHSAQWQFNFEGNKQKYLESLHTEPSNRDNSLHKSIGNEKELYELSDKIVSVTGYMKHFIINQFCISEDKISVIYNGIDNANFYAQDKKDKIKIREQLGLKTNEKIVLFSGRLDAGKGLYPLIDGFTEVVKHNENVRLVIIGEDSGTDRISQFLTHCENIWSMVTFTGFLEYEKVIKFYQVADIGIIPSIFDHCPYVALEMIAHNIPLIISNTEGLNEILSDNQSIYLKPLFDNEGNLSFDKKEIAYAILSLVNDVKKVKCITNDYQELIGTRFSSERMAREMYSVLKSLCVETVEV